MKGPPARPQRVSCQGLASDRRRRPPHSELAATPRSGNKNCRSLEAPLHPGTHELPSRHPCRATTLPLRAVPPRSCCSHPSGCRAKCSLETTTSLMCTARGDFSRRVRAFTRAHGQSDNTDPIDALLLNVLAEGLRSPSSHCRPAPTRNLPRFHRHILEGNTTIRQRLCLLTEPAPRTIAGILLLHLSAHTTRVEGTIRELLPWRPRTAPACATTTRCLSRFACQHRA